MPKQAGALFVAVGSGHLAEAERSARSLKRHMPGLPIAAFTDTPLEGPSFDCVLNAPGGSYHRGFLISALLDSPFEQTLALDTDTLVLHPFPELFDLLERFDVAAVPSPKRPSMARRDRAPSCFPMYNGGLLLVRRSPATRRFLERWLELYRNDLRRAPALLSGKARAKPFVPNQPSLRQALFESPVRIATLPPEYNYRFDHAAKLLGRVKIIHGRRQYLERFAADVNRYTGERFCFRRGTRLVVKPGRLSRTLARLRRRGT